MKPLTPEDILNSGYETIIENCDTKECYKYATKFLQKTRELESTDTTTSEVFQLLGRLSSLNLRAESLLTPFQPMPSDQVENDPQKFVQIFSREHLTFIKNIIDAISDNEMKARMADVLWVINRDYKMAELAICSYLKSSIILEDPEKWTSCESRIQRAYRLAILLGKKNEHITKVIEHIENILDKYNGEDPLFLSQKLMSLLIEFNHGDLDKYVKLSKKCAINAENTNNFHLARAYWDVKAKWHKLNNNFEKEREALLSYAKTFIKEAEFKSMEGNHLAASHFLQRGIEAYRRIGNTRTLVDEVHKKLIAYEQESIKEMQRFSTEFDVTECVRKTINNLTGKNLFDSLFSLSLMVQSPKIDNIKKEVIESANKYPMQHLVSAVVVNNMGKVIGRQASMFSSDPKEVEEATRQNMLRHADFHRLFMTQSVIEPARHHIILEHNPQLSDLTPIIYNNPFIPENREMIFAKGLLNGLQGDFVEAAHLLIPQIENSMRTFLDRNEALTSNIDSNGVQNERNLNDTLYASEIEEIFGKDIVFDLQGLLVERFGANLRNRLAHGLMDYSYFFSIHVSYLWAMTLRLCCWPLIIEKYKSDD